MSSRLQLAQESRARRGERLADEQIEVVLDRVGLSEERCLELSNADRVGPEARKKLKGILDHYRHSTHPFTECVRDNRKRFGARAEQVCAVVKDMIVGSTHWRKGPKKTNLSEYSMCTPCSMLDDDVVALVLEVDRAALSELLAEEVPDGSS